MGRLPKLISITIVLILLLSINGGVYASIWEFGSSGEGKNHFTPRGFLVDTGKGQHWLSSGYNNSGENIYYSGTKNGVDYLDAKKSDGSNYTFYAMVHRNPEPGKEYLAVYKDGVRISLNSYTGTTGRGEQIDPSGNGTCWVIPINDFELEAGCVYEFCFLKGMMANNGLTLVLAPGSKSGKYQGYIQLNDNDYTTEEKQLYDSEKNNEYKFVANYSKDSSSGEYSVELIPMRFTVQTYADLTRWDSASDAAQSFIDSVTEDDYKQGRYVRENIKNLVSTLNSLNDKAENTVKKQTKKTANKSIDDMIKKLNDALKKARDEKPVPADLTELNAKIKEAEKLYNVTNPNTGTKTGQYGLIEVQALKDEIDIAKEMDKYTSQSKINAQVIALQNAIDEVNASLVQESVLTFYDKATGIFVTVPESSLPSGATMTVIRTGNEDSDFKQMQKNLPDKRKEALMYDISFYSNESKVVPKADATVQIPVADTISVKSSVIYSYSEKKGLTKIKSIKANGIQTFKSGLNKRIVLAGATATEAEKSKTRKEKTKILMEKTKSKKGSISTNALMDIKKKKEIFKKPIEKLLNNDTNLAAFSSDIKHKTNPFYLVLFAIALAIVAASYGINAVITNKRRGQ